MHPSRGERRRKGTSTTRIPLIKPIDSRISSTVTAIRVAQDLLEKLWRLIRRFQLKNQAENLSDFLLENLFLTFASRIRWNIPKSSRVKAQNFSHFFSFLHFYVHNSSEFSKNLILGWRLKLRNSPIRKFFNCRSENFLESGSKVTSFPSENYFWNFSDPIFCTGNCSKLKKKEKRKLKIQKMLFFNFHAECEYEKFPFLKRL